MAKCIHTEITKQIIEQIETGSALPWYKGWKDKPCMIPLNPSSKREYSGINIVALWTKAIKIGYASNQWLTYRQSKDLGLQVKKNERATTVVFFKNLVVDGDSIVDERTVPMLRKYSVFNRDQMDGETSDYELQTEASNIDLFIRNIPFKLISGKPAFIPSLDLVKMPPPCNFNNQSSHYATLLHELIHWTGHCNRLDRITSTSRFSPEYAFEELVAELGAAFLCAELGITAEQRHADYIDSYLVLLKNDKKAIFKAAAAASKACKYLHSLQP
ncbi:MAG: DUF1738 domain-containing protein [Planctomycetes bacterium]|nr:DUF1738 domain-containing protein [Planctomycetota bacterium]